jgi:hypothetical protein
MVQWPRARLAVAPSPLFFSPNRIPPCGKRIWCYAVVTTTDKHNCVVTTSKILFIGTVTFKNPHIYFSSVAIAFYCMVLFILHKNCTTCCRYSTSPYPSPSPRAPCSTSSVAAHRPCPALARCCRTMLGPLPISSPVLEPFSILFLVIKQAQASSTTRHCRCTASSSDKAPRPSLPPKSHQKAAPTPPPAPRALHPTQDPWSRLEIQFSTPSFRALLPPHGSPSSSKLLAATPSASPGSPYESHSLARGGQPTLPSRCRSTMEVGVIPCSELLFHPRSALVLRMSAKLLLSSSEPLPRCTGDTPP